MSEPTFFFSYARSDSEFVLRLANDLREGGAELWLDQLDIAGGAHWDQAVEEALNSCRGVVISLSPDSVESHNVMDEVSFALEERKIVIPIMHRDCRVPFRIRRLQRIDFTADYETGLAQLLQALQKPGENPTESADFRERRTAAPEPTSAELEPPTSPTKPDSPLPTSTIQTPPDLSQPDRSNTILTLGIISVAGILACFPVSLVCGIIGWTMAHKDLKNERFTSSIHGRIKKGWICSIIGSLCSFIYLVIVVAYIVYDPSILFSPGPEQG